MEDVNLMQVRGTVYTGGRDHGTRRCREHTHSPLPSLKQMISGFEMQNNFSIFALDPASKMRIGDMPLFRAHEHSTCFQRQCCGRLREFSMDVQSQTGEQFINIWRPFKCTCACFNRCVPCVTSCWRCWT